MRITLFAAGTRGDVQPFVALACRLRAEGSVATVATHRNFERLVTDAGVAFEPLPGDLEGAFATDVGRRYMSAGRNTLQWASAFNAIVSSFWAPMLESFVDSVPRADAIVISSISRPAALVAAARGIPYFGAYLGPNYATSQFAHRLAPQLRLGRAYNRLSHLVVPVLLLPRGASPVTDAWIARHGLPKKPAPPAATLYGFSSSVVPAPERMPNAHVTGYWFLDSDKPAEASPALAEFLDASDRPKVVVTFSSISADERTTTRIADAIAVATRQIGSRTLVIGGWTKFANEPASDVLVTRAAPHDHVFPHVDLVVHHGGAGTSASALRAGVPSVVVPWCADQFFWADRLHRLGVSPPPLPASELTAARLSESMRLALHDDDMRARAAALGRRIREEDGLGAASRVILAG